MSKLKHYLSNKNLSLKAVGAYTLLSQQTNPTVTIDSLRALCPDGRKGAASALNELINAGYLKRERKSNGNLVTSSTYLLSACREGGSVACNKNNIFNNYITKDNNSFPTNTIVENEKKLTMSCDIKKVFSHWQSVMEHPSAKLDDGRTKLIRKALNMGYSADELCESITGCSLTPHNVGVNDRNQRYDGLNIILRNADQIDRFIGNAKAPPKNNGGLNETARGVGYRRSKADIHAEATKRAFEPDTADVPF